MITQDPQLLRAARRELESEIQRALDFVAIARSQLNALRPISRMPTEILREVFTLIAMDDDEYLQWNIDDSIDPEEVSKANLSRINLGWVKGASRMGLYIWC